MRCTLELIKTELIIIGNERNKTESNIVQFNGLLSDCHSMKFI